ncbi:MAG: hypothetical protein K0R78_1261 [Pelosinus sp.]|jgi:hypothetical protein|nr:hypothetical protein [Pelosinus sp.]
MTLEDSVMATAMILVLVSGVDLVISSDMPENTSIIVSTIDVFKTPAIIIVAKLLAK